MHWLLGVLINVVLFWVHCVEALVIRWVPLKYRAKNISGEVALVTGAGGGIGRLISLGLAMQGCQVVCWDIAKQANEETARLIRTARGVAHTFQVDLTDKEDIYRTAQLVKEQVGKVNILVNNAGVVTGKTLLECTDDQIKRTFDVNILAHFWTVKSFLPEMLKTDKGHIVNVASLAGMNGINRLVDYCSSKFAAVGFDESLRTELQFEGHHGIKTTVICPFFVKTPLFDGIDSKIMPVLEPEYVAEQTIKAILTEEHVVILPRYALVLMLLKSFTPVKAMNRLVDLMGMADTMKAFQGPKTKYL